MTALTPKSFAAYATDWPWLPVDAAMTPRRRSSSSRRLTRLMPPRTFSYWDSADDLAALLDHLGVGRAVIGGESQGGFVSLRFALRHPAQTAGLVLIDTQAGTEDPDKALQYDLMHEVWVGSGPNDQLLEMVAAILIGNQRPESAAWIPRWKALDPKTLT